MALAFSPLRKLVQLLDKKIVYLSNMTNDSTRSKRIVKNTAVLYIRMLFLMAVGLYTSRIVLQVLGVEDFGIYNVVGGFVALFAVLSKSLSAAASRFLNYTMGKGDAIQLSKVFSSTLIIHLFLAITIAVFAEAIGVWFLNHEMIIPEHRLYAANWVFQFSVASFCFSLISVPYQAAIIAHEHMNIYAVISIGEGIAKLAITYILLISTIDKLILYSILMLGITIAVWLANLWYCKRNYQECTAKHTFERGLYKEIFGFAGWNMFGAASNVLRNQGGNILLNLFGGPVVNAARAVGNQVLHAVDGFVGSFTTALNPQITQSYASGDRKYMMMLVYRGARLAYYLMLIISLPIFINTEYILSIWLTTVPDCSTIFVQLTLIWNLIEVVSRPLITVMLATGNIKKYQLIVGGLQMFNIPISYACLKFGCNTFVVYYVAIGLSISMLVSRLLLLKGMIQLDAFDFFKHVILNVILVTLISIPIPYFFAILFPVSIVCFLAVSAIGVIVTGISIFFVGCSKDERIIIATAVRKYISKKH